MAKAGILFVGTRSGFEVWSDPGGVGRWRRRISSLTGQAVHRISAADPLDLTVSAPHGSFASRDGGLNWQAVGPAEPAAAAPQTLLLRGLPHAELRLTADAVLQRCNPGDWTPTLQAAVTLLHPVSYHQDSVWAGGVDGTLWLSSDRGRSWQAIGTADATVLALCALRLI